MVAPDPRDRSHIAQIAVLQSWVNTSDRTARTASGRQAALDRFEKQVDPDGTMNPVERAQRADAARKLFYSRMAYQSAKVRREKAAGRKSAPIRGETG